MARKKDRLTVKEAADLLGVKIQTVYNWKFTGQYSEHLTFHKQALNGRVYLMRKQVERFAKDYII